MREAGREGVREGGWGWKLNAGVRACVTADKQIDSTDARWCVSSGTTNIQNRAPFIAAARKPRVGNAGPRNQGGRGLAMPLPASRARFSWKTVLFWQQLSPLISLADLCTTRQYLFEQHLGLASFLMPCIQPSLFCCRFLFRTKAAASVTGNDEFGHCSGQRWRKYVCFYWGTVAANVYEANTVLLNSWSVIFAQCRTRLTRLP